MTVNTVAKRLIFTADAEHSCSPGNEAALKVAVSAGTGQCLGSFRMGLVVGCLSTHGP